MAARSNDAATRVGGSYGAMAMHLRAVVALFGGGGVDGMLSVLLGLAIWWVIGSLIGGLLYLAGGR